MSESRRKKDYRQKVKRGAGMFLTTILVLGIMYAAENAARQLWQEANSKNVVYAANGEQIFEEKINVTEAVVLETETVITEETESMGQESTVQKEKTMYLTFDDGPTAENTVSVLDTLKEKNIRATFFVVGENVEKHPDVAKRIVEEGHTLGIHCYSHDYEKIYESVDSYLEDFEKAYRIVYEVTGVKAELFRFPGGSINAYNKGVYKDIITAMTESGFIYYDWNASLEDAVKVSTPEKLLANAKETTLDRKKVIMLCHDTVYNTTFCLGELIEQFPEYQMEPLTPEVTPIQF